MPNRILKESICESRDLSSCSFFTQDLYKRLITYADDYGRFNADPEIMVARLYPRELNVVSVDDVVDSLIELSGVGKVGFYTSSPRRDIYGAFPHWADHQRIRESKKKEPEPTDTTVNDWYLRRFISIDMKVAIIERDNFTCKICGKKISNAQDAKRLVKMGTGLFHIDHIVPCCQGGRATMENLRLTCEKCNLSRKKKFSIDEIISFQGEDNDFQQSAATFGNSPQLAATCGESRLESNPIQSKKESESESNNARFGEWYEEYPRKIDPKRAKAAWDKLKVDESLFNEIMDGLRKWKRAWDDPKFVPYPATWLNNRRWEAEPPKGKRNAALDYEQTAISKTDFDAMVVDLNE